MGKLNSAIENRELYLARAEFSNIAKVIPSSLFNHVLPSINSPGPATEFHLTLSQTLGLLH
jgi:hypothetical protein